jgi:hypothetical protein
MIAISTPDQTTCNVPRLLVVSVTSIRRVSDDECDRLVGESLQGGQAVRVDKGDVLAGVLLAIENAHGGLHLWVMDVLVNSNFGGKFFETRLSKKHVQRCCTTVVSLVVVPSVGTAIRPPYDCVGR